MSKHLDDFLAYRATSNAYETALRVMSWDLRCTAPAAAREERIHQMGALSSVLFLRSVSEEYRQMLFALSEPDEFASLSPALQDTVVRDLKKTGESRNIPADFQREFTVMRSRCELAWQEAKAANDYAIFAPWLKKNIDMTAQYAAFLYPEKPAYEALLCRNVEDLTLSEVDRLFEEYRDGVLPLIPAMEKAASPVPAAFHVPCEEAALRKAQELVLDYIGLDRSRVVLGESMHPLTYGISLNDVRITNHFRPDNPVDYLFSAIHEGGHGIYNQNVSPAYSETAWGVLNYSDLHESQSRFFENVLGHDPAFWTPIFPELQKLLPSFRELTPESFIAGVNHVCRSEVRTEADEVTYGLHILLRHELEKQLFSGELRADDVREAWNEKSRELLGLTPRDDARGILQDLHWSSVYFGYFPTYLLGTLYDGMFASAAEKELGSLSDLLSSGNIHRITKWLNENVHAHGSRYSGPTLLKKLTGEELSAKPMLTIWKKRYPV